jgi:hypothetical protein
MIFNRSRNATRQAMIDKPMEGFQMITVSKDQLDTVEYLLQQSAQGNHVLFDVDTVRHVFTLPAKPMNEQEAYEVEHHIEKLIAAGTLDKQKAYLENLSEDLLFRVVKTYFNILENNLFETQTVRH